jgi:hypothetical protein
MATWTCSGSRLDRAFDGDGKLRLSKFDIAWDIALDHDQLVVAGENNENISVTRRGTDGKLDTRFGNDGRAEITRRATEAGYRLTP